MVIKCFEIHMVLCWQCDMYMHAHWGPGKTNRRSGCLLFVNTAELEGRTTVSFSSGWCGAAMYTGQNLPSSDTCMQLSPG